MRQYRCLDLFCGAGGATRGLQMAGFEVTGVDINPQPHYVGDHFCQADALTFPLGGYHLLWASPPCEHFSEATPMEERANHPNLIEPVRARLRATGTPFIIENVAGARGSLKEPTMLCGTMFGLPVWRHRFFEVWPRMSLLTPPCQHIGRPVVAAPGSNARAGRAEKTSTATVRAAFGIEWMTGQEIRKAIPPAYAEYLARQVIEYLRRGAA